MRLLILMRGAPGSGKSTFVKEHDLERYTLCADDFRTRLSAPILDIDGNEGIDQSVGKDAWDMLFECLETRMKRGDLTVVDACNSKATELNQYKELMEKYRYRCWVIDFTDVPIEEVKKRNKEREEWKRCSDTVVEKYYARQAGQKIPSRFQVIKREDFDREFAYLPKDYSEYESVYVIGDIHGCYSALKELIPEVDPKAMYVFCGDYLDRGIENREVLEQVMEWSKLPNMYFLEGNHERHLYNYSIDEPIKSREFVLETTKQIGDVSKKDIRIFYKRLGQCAYFNYNGQLYFVCHGGVSKLPKNLLTVGTEQFIKGVGRYEDIGKIAEAFERNNPSVIQIHGHRKNIYDDVSFWDAKNVVNLEGGVEFGKYLRAVKITKSGIEEISIKNNVFREQKPTDKEEETKEMNIANLVMQMRASKFITEKVFENGISSFNFNRDAFYKKEWNETTTKARGLFIQNNKIAARGYDKFFNVGERRETELSNLDSQLTFPVSVYKKYNGYLGLLGYDEIADSLLFCSKSSIQGDFAGWFKNIFMEKYGQYENQIKEYLKSENRCLVFEVIDPVNDPHIIEYKESKLVLLDSLKRTLNYDPLPYIELLEFGKQYNMEVKELLWTFNSKKELYKCIENAADEDFKVDGKYIEGFVICGKNNFMTKVKTGFYLFWKQMRSLSQRVFRLNKDGKYVGYIDKTSSITSAAANNFYNYICKLAVENYDGPLDIISLRKKYLEEL